MFSVTRIFTRFLTANSMTTFAAGFFRYRQWPETMILLLCSYHCVYVYWDYVIYFIAHTDLQKKYRHGWQWVYYSSSAGLLPVTGIRHDNGNLIWNGPQNAPADCIMSYNVTWDDDNYATSDNRTFVPIDRTTGLEFCRIYTLIIITPIGLLGTIDNSNGELRNMAFTPTGT